jgi:superfamily I DNA and/or RNA helicase
MLESLIKGIPARLRQTPTTISEGFNPDELKHRRTILTYQHRMHPDISKFPREQYYKKEGALLDLDKPTPINTLREWNYSRYMKRSIWIDVKGKTTKNYNLDEADKMISELNEFLEYASKNDQPEGKEWTVACLTFYKGQETRIRERLQELTKKEQAFANFNLEKNGRKVNIKLHSVDKFQGQEADIVFLSMVQTFRDGFLDNPNRLNVAITRAKFQLVIIGNHEYFSKQSKSDDLKKLAQNTVIQSL